MKGALSGLYRANHARPRAEAAAFAPGRLGVFAYDGAGKGEVCLFVPDDPESLGGRVKARFGPGTTHVEGDALHLALKGGGSRSWQLCDTITDPVEAQEFLDFAEAHDRIIHHLLKGSRLLGE